MRETVIRIPRRAMIATGSAIVLVAALIGLTATGVLARVFDPGAVAPQATVAFQQSAAERDVERAYEQAVEQVRKVRALNLAISAQQADGIANKAFDDLKALRHSAFVAMGQLLGMAGADAEQYAVATESRFNQAPVSARPSPSPVLLAPRFYTIVSRMSELSAQISDKATLDLTAPAPTPSPTPTATSRPTSTPSPSPSR